MKRTCTILASILPALCALAVPRYWEADVRSPAAFQTAAYRGETVQLTARLADRGAPFEVPAGATARMLVSTNDFRDGCWEWPATVSTNGLVRAIWTPDMDPGGPAVRIFLAVSESGTNVNYGANCTMRLLGSPGATPNALPLPAATIDFAAVAVLNAPWLEAESDPVFAAWADSHIDNQGIVNNAGAADYSYVANRALDYIPLGGIDLAIRSAAKSATNYTDSAVATRLSRAEAEDGFTEWTGLLSGYTVEFVPPSEWWLRGQDSVRVATTHGPEDATSLYFESENIPGSLAAATRTRLRPTPAMEAAWDAKLDDSDLSGYATSADLAAVEASASLVGLLLQGSNVVAEVTNYNSRVHAPELRLLQLSESNEYYQVWAETNGLARTLAGAIEHADGATNALDAAKADRAWSHHTSGLGADAPDGYTWMSTPRTVLAGGLEFEKHAVANGAIWILVSNGMAADFHAQTNNTAFLDMSSADGTPVFRIEKTDSFLVGVDVTSLSVDGDTLICGVNAVATEHPLARVRASLSEGDWAREEDGIPASLATVQWSGSSGNWVCRVTKTHSGPSIFATMEYLQEGGTKIINSAPIDVSEGILCTDGIHRVRPVYNNGSVTWQVMQ